MSWGLAAEVAVKDFEFDDETIIIKQVVVNIFGHEFYLDPDQVDALIGELEAAKKQLGEN